MHPPDPSRGAAGTGSRTDLDLLLNRPGSHGARLDLDVDALAAHLPLLDECVAMTANGTALISDLGTYAPPSFTGDPLPLVPDAVLLRLHRPSVRAFVAMDADEGRHEPPGLWMFDHLHRVVHRGYLVSHRGTFAMDLLRMARPAAAEESRAEPAGDSSDQLGTLDGLLADATSGADAGVAVEPAQVVDLLCHLCDTGVPLSIGVLNRGCLQLHTGALDLVEHRGNMITMVSGGCNAAFHPADLAEARITRPHGVRGPTSVVRLHAADGRCVAVLAQLGLTTPALATTWEQTISGLVG
ncbi:MULTISPECIES: hypothetical protein [unclassified Saccharopolyspora]|uniref:hypothetical protein n=1 Tax=unclassified Saccharopolyspora TaxID=2646250 RepID=UPI001CD632BD|nr:MULTISPECIES: hypothetical protein [unclassified Saccharopolyspora]MCA1186320.1 hypothetical protein [Saccharopolyspora sp. 6T]MCA1192161.1 hypothetical protein [Saccharopolyspora sp. 6V]MCA1225816.1 hypothetical protein [Saccharopolyspora sp. 6M]MCA1279985.1 hypothetical protein [Saccharopolyspora sp. 7B]